MISQESTSRSQTTNPDLTNPKAIKEIATSSVMRESKKLPMLIKCLEACCEAGKWELAQQIVDQASALAERFREVTSAWAEAEASFARSRPSENASQGEGS